MAVGICDLRLIASSREEKDAARKGRWCVYCGPATTRRGRDSRRVAFFSIKPKSGKASLCIYRTDCLKFQHTLDNRPQEFISIIINSDKLTVSWHHLLEALVLSNCTEEDHCLGPVKVRMESSLDKC